MSNRWLLASVLALLLLVQGLGPSLTPVKAQSGSSAEIFRLVNEVRAGYGLAPFVWDGTLAVAAQNQANYMATNNIYSHTGAGGSSPQSRAQAAGYPGRATENIVGGSVLTPRQGVIWWQNSPIHFSTMISQQYIHAGVGFAQGHDQNFYALVVGVPASAADSNALAAPLAADDTLAPVAPIQLAEPDENGGITHVVGSGQSFWAIAARYEIPLEQLYLYNNLTEESVINPGDKLIIRLADGQVPPPTPTPPASHIVREGESLWTIAAWYKLSLEELLYLNSMEEDSLVQPGDEVRIRLLPGESPPPTPTLQAFHTVRSGDTAWGISEQYGLTLDELFTYNALTQNSILSIGQQLLIIAPSATPSVTPTPRPTVQAPQSTPSSPTATNTATPAPAIVAKANQMVATPGPQLSPSVPIAWSNSTLALVGLFFFMVGIVAVVLLGKRG